MLKIVVAVAALALPAAGETIRLKNGRKILADTVREAGNKVEYTVGEDTYAISKNSVAGIDTGGTPLVTQREPVPPMSVDVSGLRSDAELEARLVRDGKLDTELLAAVLGQGPPERAAFAAYFAATHHRTNGRLAEAVRFLAQARSLLPENGMLAANYAIVLAESHRFREALAAAQEAARLSPNVGIAHTMLGYSLYHLGRMQEAVQSLKKAVELEPGDSMAQQLLEKAQRELAAEGDFSEDASSHFALRYEGGRAPANLRRQILQTLEAHYDTLSNELDYSPRHPIHVILYTDKQYFDITKAPKWTGAVNDGKLRIPISGLTAVDSNLSRTLKHELAHSFINLATNGRAPTWLHEGVAQLVEPRSIDRDGRRLSMLYNSGNNIPLNQLETSFVRFTEAEAAVAYAQALATMEYISEVYGMSSVVTLMKRLGEGQSNESALRTAVHSGYAQFDRELGQWLRKNYDSGQ